ncbi:alkaline phosphatase D family protein [Crocosphaera chwakensis]|uniref:PhoD-like phosphatase metallophosphatase domain-containing protein n=1 Tax=Crocosphaera chwakensis CCY0110 TaxID=391612 RepID=A3ITB0_9CHRO|nr:hypothetical protein [Crocosphaera chwakensis]EAZ90295.1 hypothetical protein CY0110_04201 [Crocosphaera chwakensis CCY0110]
MNLSQSVFEYLPKLKNLPLILAGPLLRRTERDRVVVWLALKEPRTIELEIYETKKQGSVIGRPLFTGKSKTIALGKNLHIATITAQTKGEKPLQPGEIYAYNIYVKGDETTAYPTARYNLIDDIQVSNYSLSYFPHQLPTFALSPDNLNQLKIVHGSCRKPHGGGKDTLSCLDNIIQNSAHLASERPHQLFLTGDQIYGDDVADPMLWLAQGVNELLLGWSEALPLMQGTILSTALPPGQRSNMARIEGGLTAMVKNKPEKAKSHLFSFGEYAAVYLLAWSPILMPDRLPPGNRLFNNGKQAKKWEQEIEHTNSFINDLAEVRRALANVPIYTICDDHDISDDWYLNREWCDRVLGKPLGKRIVQNGLLAYALFQAWGNTPEQFESGTSGEKLLKTASRWLMSQGKDTLAKAECDRYLGIPETEQTTRLPKLEKDEDVLILSRDSQAIPWHYSISSDKHEVIVVDTRTWRGYPPGENNGLQPPMLLCPKAFKQQLQVPLAQIKPEIEATIVVLPTNLVTLGIIDRIQQLKFNRAHVFSNDVGDSWNFHQEAFAQLLLALCQERKRVIILSGDIHYSCAVRLTHWFHDSLETSVLVQLTSSAIKNSELATRLAHTKIKSLFPEKTERFFGWNQPFKLQKITQSDYLDYQKLLPDWQYRIQWCQRQPSQSLAWRKVPRHSPDQSTNLVSKLITYFLFWIWRNRWLQEGLEVVGRNNLSLVKFHWSTTKAVIQETYWYPPWKNTITVKSSYEISLELDSLPPLSNTK